VGRRAVVSKMRSVQTTIWTKSKKFRECDAVEKLLFLFLITNPETSLCGAYEMMLDDIAHYTGIDHRNLPHVFAGLDRRGLARYEGGWVIIPNYKALYDNPKVQKGIERELAELPAHIRDSLSIDYDSPSHPIRNSNSNSNSNLTEKSAPSPTRYNNLVDKYGKAVVDDYVQRVKDYADSKGKHYRNYVAAASNWLKKDNVSPRPGWGVVQLARPTDLTACPQCGGEVRQLHDEAICRACDSFYVWDGENWKEDPNEEG
jgi:hypothetical protein